MHQYQIRLLFWLYTW